MERKEKDNTNTGRENTLYTLKINKERNELFATIPCKPVSRVILDATSDATLDVSAVRGQEQASRDTRAASAA